jgi:hypothetical protein
MGESSFLWSFDLAAATFERLSKWLRRSAGIISARISMENKFPRRRLG